MNSKLNRRGFLRVNGAAGFVAGAALAGSAPHLQARVKSMIAERHGVTPDHISLS